MEIVRHITLEIIYVHIMQHFPGLLLVLNLIRN
ncbi:hypothetical protein LINPERPRIM_LOCUS32728 [Linum perenne]